MSFLSRALSVAAAAVLASSLVSAPAQAVDIAPPGANDWSCKPSAEHPYPVVLVPGTFESMEKNWSTLSPYLKSAGYCVYALNYGQTNGVYATAPVKDSAKELAPFIDAVRSATGAKQVDLVGHSQGGMMPRYYIKFLGGAPYVDDLVGIAPSNHGTKLLPSENPLAALLPGLICVACNQQTWGSAFLQHLNAGDETPGGVSYTQIESRYDEVVVPYTSAFLTPGPRTTNVTLQSLCPGLYTEHLLIPNNKVTIAVTLNALRNPGPAAKDFRPAC